MFSRKTTKTLGEVYQSCFRSPNPNRAFRKELLYDFLYEHDYETWFINKVTKLPHQRMVLKYFIMGLHTGESIESIIPDVTQQQKSEFSKKILQKLAEDIIIWTRIPHAYVSPKSKQSIPQLLSELEIDGYIFQDGKLYYSEATILDTENEIGILEKLIQDVKLNNQGIIKHHLELSETHYINDKWDDSISNSRKFLESILNEIAAGHHLLESGQPINTSKYSQAFKIRDYLYSKGLFEKKEKEAIAVVYGLLSETGSHPYIAEKDQARLMRYLALTLAQFALLRYNGFIKSYKIELLNLPPRL